MNLNIDKYYIIKPKSIMFDILDDSVDEFFTQPHLWVNQEPMREDRTINPAYSISFLKLAFMLELMQMRANSTKEALYQLLGEPMKFSVEMFDKWWSIEHIRMHKGTNRVIRYTTPEQIDLLDKTGYEDTIRAIKYTLEDIKKEKYDKK